VVGEDLAGAALETCFRDMGVSSAGIVRAKGWVTPTKTRFLAGWTHTVAQQVLRVDREPPCPPPDAVLAKLRLRLHAKLKTADALAVSDYGFGVASPSAVAKALRSVKRRIPASLDARYHLHAYAASGITAATPNEAELEALHHTVIGKNLAELELRGAATLKQMKLRSLLVT